MSSSEDTVAIGIVLVEEALHEHGAAINLIRDQGRSLAQVLLLSSFHLWPNDIVSFGTLADVDAPFEIRVESQGLWIS